MTTRFVKGKPRTETPRLKDLPTSLETERERSANHSAAGRFTFHNRAAIGAGFKASVRKSFGELGRGPEADALVRQALKLYLAILRSLPSDGAGVRVLVAASARNATLATFYSNAAAGVGLASPEGLKLAEASRAHDKTAQGLSVAAYDRAVREAAARPRAAHDPLARFLDAPSPAPTEEPEQ